MSNIDLVKDSEYELSVHGAKVAVEMLQEDFINDVEKLQNFGQTPNKNLLDFALEEHRMFKKLVSVFNLSNLGKNRINSINEELKSGDSNTNEKFDNIDLEKNTKNNLINLINEILQKEEDITINVNKEEYNSKNLIGENISNEDLADIYMEVCKSLKSKYEVKGPNDLQKILENDKCIQLKDGIEDDVSSVRIKDLNFKEINAFVGKLNNQKNQKQENKNEKNKDNTLLELINNLKQNFKEDKELCDFFVKNLNEEDKKIIDNFINEENYENNKENFKKVISIIANKYNIEYNSIIDFFNKFKEIHESIQKENDLILINNIKQFFKNNKEFRDFFIKNFLSTEDKEKFNNFMNKDNHQENKKIFEKIIKIIEKRYNIIVKKYNTEHNDIINSLNQFEEIYESIQKRNDLIMIELNQRKKDLKEIQKKQIKVPDVKVINTDNGIHDEEEIGKIPNSGRIWRIVSSGNKHMTCICIEKDMEGNVNEIIFDPNKQDIIEFLCNKFNNQNLKRYPKFINKEKLLAHSDCEVWSVYFPFIIERLMSFNKTESVLLYDMLGCKKDCEEFSFEDSSLFKQVTLLNALDDERESKTKQVKALYNYDNECYVSPDERMIDYVKNNNSCPICEYNTKYGKRGDESNFIFRNALRLTSELRTMQKDKALEYLIKSESRYLFNIDANEFNKLKIYEIINFLYEKDKLGNEYLDQILDLLAYKKFEDYDKLDEDFKNNFKEYLIEEVKKSVDESELINNNYKELFILYEQNILDENNQEELLLKNKIEENIRNITSFYRIKDNEKLIKKLFTKTEDGLYKIEPKQISISGLSKIIEYPEVQEYLKNIQNLDAVINSIWREDLLKLGTLLKKYKLPNENKYLEYIDKIVDLYIKSGNIVEYEYNALFKYGFINKNSINKILSYHIINNGYNDYIYWSEQLIQNCIIFSITPKEMEDIIKSFNEKIRKEDLIMAAEYCINNLINNIRKLSYFEILKNKGIVDNYKKRIQNVKKILSISGIDVNILNKTNENLLNCLFYMKYNGKSFEEALNYFKDNEKINEEELKLVQEKFEELKKRKDYQKLKNEQDLVNQLISYTLGKYLLLSNNTSEVINFFENTFSYIGKEKISDMLVDINKFYSESLLMYNDDNIITIFLKTKSVDQLLETELDDFIRQIKEFSQTEKGKEIQNSLTFLKDKTIDFDSLNLKEELKRANYLYMPVNAICKKKFTLYDMIINTKINKEIDKTNYKNFLKNVVSDIFRNNQQIQKPKGEYLIFFNKNSEKKNQSIQLKQKQQPSKKENNQPVQQPKPIIKEVEEVKLKQQGIQFALEELSGELSLQEGDNKQTQQSYFEYDQNTYSVFLTETAKQKLEEEGITKEEIKIVEEFLSSNYRQNKNSFTLRDINKNGFKENENLVLDKERIKIINECLGLGKEQEVELNK